MDLGKIVDLNYETLLPKIHALIQQWNRRILTPLGRVTVIKTLILPKYNHLFMSLPNPNEESLTSLNQELFRFLWKAKCDKIKRVVVTQKCLHGGLNMVNIKTS